LDLLGDVGGAMEALYYLCLYFLQPIQLHFFTIKAISKLYTAKTKETKLFMKSSKKNHKKVIGLTSKQLDDLQKDNSTTTKNEDYRKM